MPPKTSARTRARCCQRERCADTLLNVVGMGGSLMCGVGNAWQWTRGLRLTRSSWKTIWWKSDFYLCNLWLKLSVVAYCLNRTTAHRLITKRPFLISLRLLVNKRITILVRAHEVLRRSVAADVAVDARLIHVERTADVLFYFVVFIRHASQGCVISSGITSLSNSSSVR